SLFKLWQLRPPCQFLLRDDFEIMLVLPSQFCRICPILSLPDLLFPRSDSIVLMLNQNITGDPDMQVDPAPKSTPKATDRFLDRQVFPFWPALTVERLLIFLIILLTVISRFYDLGARTMAHDEINHVVPSHTISTYIYD